jgi:hypothetical protein
MVRKSSVACGVLILGAVLSVAASATRPSPSSGTFANAPDPPSASRSAGGNTFLTFTRSGVLTGTYTRVYVQENEVIIHPDGHTNFRGTNTCVCTVEGQSGTVVFRFQGTGMAGAQFGGSFVIVSGTDGLQNLRGHGTFEGAGLSGTYSGQHHFEP